MFCQIFPLISDVTMSAKFPEDPGEDDLGKPKISKPQLLSSLEMRKVLSELGNESMAENTDNTEDEDDEEEESEFQRVLAEIPDLEGDYSELSLGFNEELCLGNQVFHQDNSQNTLNTPPASDIVQPESEKSSTSADTNEAKEEKKTRIEKVVKFVEPERSQNPSNVPSPDQDFNEASTSAVNNAGLTVSSPPPVPIHKGDLIEFLVGDRTWFLVEVTGRGKIGGKNQNYLNVRYSDKSEGGVFIDQHQWRIVRRREVGPLEDAEDAAWPASARLHRVTVDLASSCEAGRNILLKFALKGKSSVFKTPLVVSTKYCLMQNIN